MCWNFVSERLGESHRKLILEDILNVHYNERRDLNVNHLFSIYIQLVSGIIKSIKDVLTEKYTYQCVANGI